MILFAVTLWLVAAIAVAGWLAFLGEKRMRERIEAAHVRERVTWLAQLEALAKSITYGQPTTPPAVVADTEATIEERASRAFGEEAIKNGIVRLREEYALLGVHNLDDEELQREAAGILFGGSPIASMPLLVRDGP